MQLKLNGRLNGTFSGWSGDTLFEFTNGQIWKQARYQYKYWYKYRPEAKILSDGSRHYLQVEGRDEMIEVRRLH